MDTLFQPIVHLETAEVVGYDAVRRGPAGTRLEAPLDLFRAARLADRLVELDWICAAAACGAALDAGLQPSIAIFLNFEPETLLAPCPPGLPGPTQAGARIPASHNRDEGRLSDRYPCTAARGPGHGPRRRLVRIPVIPDTRHG